MVTVCFSNSFEKTLKKINGPLKVKVKKQIAKIIENPESGKTMRYGRKGTREVYVPPFRLSYAWIKEEDKLLLLDLYHKDVQ